VKKTKIAVSAVYSCMNYSSLRNSQESGIFKLIVLILVLMMLDLLFSGFAEGWESNAETADDIFSIVDFVAVFLVFGQFYIYFLLYRLKPLGKYLFLPFILVAYFFSFAYIDASSTEYDPPTEYYGLVVYGLQGMILYMLYFSQLWRLKNR